MSKIERIRMFKFMSKIEKKIMSKFMSKIVYCGYLKCVV